MNHASAPLALVGRLRLVQRCQSRPISHVAAAAGVARATVMKCVRRFDEHGEAALLEASSTPRSQPTRPDHRPHTAIGNQSPVSRLPATVTNVMTQNS